ncbi:MAG: MopE-related protein [Ferruginibacter sp.]
MKKIILLLCVMLSAFFVEAQTWDGSESTDWNTPGNWNSNAVPLAAGNVVIPGSLGNYPVLASAVTINSIDMQTGSSLNFNGFSLTVNTTAGTFSYFTGATLNNSNAATDIVININNGTGGYSTYFRGNTVNDKITFNISGSNIFYDGEGGGNTYTQDASFNISGSGAFWICSNSLSTFGGNLTIIRTVAGLVDLFTAGGTVAGNFSYTNLIGNGGTRIGNTTISTQIGGTININANHTLLPNVFELNRVINSTSGGSINVTNSYGLDIRNDTLKVTSFTAAGYRGSNYAYILNNHFTGNISIADSATYSGGYITYIRSNVVNGNAHFESNSSNSFLEADNGGSGNQYTGNVEFIVTGTGTVRASAGDTSTFGGNLSFTRTGVGLSQLFQSGGNISGNFSFSNNTSGNVLLGSLSNRTSIGGTVNVSVNNASTPASFQMYRLINQTGGGVINAQNTIGFDLRNDTIVLNSLTIAGYRSPDFGTLYNNSITGNISISDDATNTSGYHTYIRENVIVGNATFTNNGTNNLYEADNAGSGNHYTGNVNITATGSGNLYLSQGDTSLYDGNLTITRTSVGITNAFASGGIIGGNFSYTNNSGGNSLFGAASQRTSINGSINIGINNIVPATFSLLRANVQGVGGSINVVNSRGFDVRNDTLSVSSLSISGYTGNDFGYFYNNSITGDVSISDDASNGSGYHTYLRGNVINGNASFTNNGTNTFYESDVADGGNHYTGNVDITATGSGNLEVSQGDTSVIDGNLTITRTSSGVTNAFASGGIIGGNFSFTNNSGGNSFFGAASKRISINGTINIGINNSAPATFSLVRAIAQGAGGSINVLNSRGFDVSNDTLSVNTLSISGYNGNDFGTFYNNSITGNVSISDGPTNSGGYHTYIRQNVITGNASFTNNGSNIFYDADNGGSRNQYSGDVVYATTGATFSVGNGDTSQIGGNLTLNSASGITLAKLRLNSSQNSTVEQLGTQPIIISQLTLSKSAAANVTLNDSVTIADALGFVGGDIISSPTNFLKFNDNTTYTNASSTSHVNGVVVKVGNDAFSFPVGDGAVLKPVSMTIPSNVNDRFTAQYFNADPDQAGYDTSAHAGSLLRVSGYEYWDVKRESGTSNVSLTFTYTDPGSGQYITVPAQARIAHWTGSTWEDLGNGGSTGTTSGTITTAAPVSNFSPFTFGSVNLANNPLLDAVTFTYYADNDADTFGDADNSITSPSPTPPAGYVTTSTDCDDNDNTVYPGAPELCDNKDNDCDGTIDDGVVPPTFYRDFDNDGFGDAANTQQACTAPVGYVSDNTDCDDADNTVYPNAPELCDGKDNDCDGTIDDGVGSTFYRDLDADGFGDAANSQVTCSAPAGYVSNNTDCDDADNTVYPNAPELCDGKDNDCDGTIDDGTGITFYRDLDGDGFGDAANSQVGCSAPSGYVSNDDDCDDTDNTVFPNAPELCDGKDNDCDGTIDDGAGTTPYYADADQDGFGDPNVSVTGCTIPPGYVADNTDCNDADNTVYPNAPELCDGKDNDCDGTIDDGVGTTFYRDLDADGFGDATNSQVACSAPTGYVTDNTDCDDTDNTVYPNAPELCDGKDNDCDGTIDDGAGTTPYYADADQDGFGDPNVSVTGCTIPPGYVADNTDCNDADNTVYPNAPELCDGKDNDCDGTIDDGVGTTYYRDLDGDGFGDAANSQVACTVPTGYVSDNTDCDDTDNTVYPNAPELCDGKDNNCDGSIDEGVQTVFYADSDADGFGNINDTLHRCFAPPGYVLDNTDCDDTDDTVYPGAPEITDGQDNDCDGLIDEGGLLTFYLDSDNDGFGDISNSVSAATAPPGYVSDNTDCDDTDNTVYPGAPELCDGKDNDCDGTIDGPVSTPIVIGPTNMCPFVGTAQQVVFTIAPLPGVTGYQWSVPPTVNIVSGQNTNTLTVTILAGFTASANKQIRVTTTSPCGTSPLGIHYLLAQYPSTPGFITGPAEACTFVGTGNEAVYKINKVTAATAYTWTASAGMTINSHPGGAGINDTIITVLYAPTFTGGTITVRSENNCGSSINVRQFTITNGNTATPGAIQGPGNACLYMPSAAIPAGTEATYIIRAVLNATSYTWAVPAGASISSHPGGTGANDTVIVVSYSSAFAGGNITVAANGSCGSSNTRSLSIQANLKPGAIGAISANETQACPDRQVVYSIVLPSNTNWVQWTVPANAVILNGQGTASITVSYPAANAGSVTATPSNGCGVGKTRSLQVSLPACRPAAGFAKGTVPQPMPQRGSLEVQVFPNPTHSEFNVKLTSASKERVQVRIYDVNGKQYLPGNININELTNFGNSLKAGVYLLEVIQGSQRNITRLVKF